MRIENEQVHYRTRFELCPFETTTSALIPALRAIYKWVYDKEARRGGELFDHLRSEAGMQGFLFDSFQHPTDYPGGLNSEDCIALSARSIRKGEGVAPRFWAMEYDEPDGRHPFRHWHTRIGLSVTDAGTCIINAKVSYYMLPGYFGMPLRDPGANIPGFAKAIIDLAEYQCCVGETVIENEPVVLGEDNFASEFVENLTSAERELPLILVTSDPDGKYPIDNLRDFTSRLLGMANVYILDWRNRSLRSLLLDLFRRDTPAFAYRCNKCSVRIYLPGIDLDDEDGWRPHRFYTPDDILGRYKNVRVFTDMLNRSLGRSYLKTEDDILDLSDISLREGRIAVEENRKKISELRSRLAAAQSRKPPLGEPSTASTGGEQLEALKRQLSEEQDNSAFLRELIEAMDQSQKSLEDQNEALELKLLELEQENQDCQGLRRFLESETRRANDNADEAKSLRNELSAINTMRHVPTTLEELLALAEALWKDRIVVLDEARRSARAFRQYDLDESWQMLSSMANSLWKLCFAGEGSVNLEQAFRRETGIVLTLRESGATNADPECRRLRKRSFGGRTIDITPHIKGEGARNSSRATDKFRIHFCIDDQTRRLIIGHCGDHLKTAGTNRM